MKSVLYAQYIVATVTANFKKQYNLKTFLLILIILLFSLTLFGQNKELTIPEREGSDSTSLSELFEWENQRILDFGIKQLTTDTTFEEFYRISNKCQIIEVYKNGNKYAGQVISFTNTYVSYEERNKKKSKTISQKLAITPDTAELIFTKFKTLDNIPDQWKISGWGRGFDGVTYIIENSTKQKYLMKNFWSPSAQTDSVQYKSEILDLINFLYNDLHFYQKYENFIQTLPGGSYTDGFINLVIPKKKRQIKKNRR